MPRRPEFLRLPGISTKDPNFYDGADYSDRDRFAQPVKDGTLDPLIERPGTTMGREEPDEIPAGTNPSPFKLGGI